ncbi:MAG: hypothetical protein LQ340_002495 [Diploschistes diacapsis]|nr:MAG: hypothetical protein LQ340_002495 [Diploschistes diacapsis]
MMAEREFGADGHPRFPTLWAPTADTQSSIKHIFSGQIESCVYHGSSREGLAARFQDYDIVLTTYETLRSEWENSGPLLSNKWLRIILDEAHHIRNRSSKVFKSTLEIQARYRWCLTGTPIHNSLDDYGALLTFVGVEPFNDKSMFDYWIATPIKEKRPHSLHRLKDLVKATCLRRTKKSPIVSLNLAKPVEKIEYVRLQTDDQKLYDFFKKKTADVAARVDQNGERMPRTRKSQEGNILALMSILRLICNHGKELLPSAALALWTGSDKRSLNRQMMNVSPETCEVCGEDLKDSESKSSETRHVRHICLACAPLNEPIEEAQTDIPLQKGREIATGRYKTQELVANDVCPSAKVKCLLHNLRKEKGDSRGSPIKSVLFSYWTKMLDLIELSLRKQGFVFRRIDGQTSLQARGEALSQFKEDPTCTIMLASIGSCGEGVDLTAASNVHLIEPHWNPAIEAQAVDRVHRKGQTHPVTVTRYIVPNSIETVSRYS